MSNIILDGSFVHIPISPIYRAKVIISKGNKADTYFICKEVERNVFPLQYGNGLYSIKVYYNIRGDKYSLALSQTLNATDTSQCWLQPSQYVWYDNKVRELSKKINASSPIKGILAYYEYCFNTIKLARFRTVWLRRPEKYLPELEKMEGKKKGLVFDKAALFCALCRINGIECKLVLGKLNKTTYHAWCQVKIEGKWRTVDTTWGRKYKVDAYEAERIS